MHLVSVPKSAVPPPLLKVWGVVIVAGVPQLGNVAIAIEARRWLKRVHHVYHAQTVLRLPHAIGKSGNQKIIVCQIVPTGEGRA